MVASAGKTLPMAWCEIWTRHITERSTLIATPHFFGALAMFDFDLIL